MQIMHKLITKLLLILLILIKMSDNKYNFLKAQVKAFHPNWTEEQVNKECEKILNEGEGGEDESCLYCGS